MKAAMIREEWLNKARELLPNPADRADFYEAIMARAFDIDLPHFANPIAGAMFAMVESAISADITKYENKCERNRENARKRQTSGGYQSLPIAATGSEPIPNTSGDTQSLPNTNTSTNTSTSTNTNTSTSTSTNTISIEKEPTEEKEKFLIYGCLFSRGCISLKQEVESFWNYYAALGWKNNKGAQIVSKTSAAAMWRLSTDAAPQTTARDLWFRAFKNAKTTNPIIWTSFRDMQAVVRDDTITLVITTCMSEEEIDHFENRFAPQLQWLMKQYRANQLEYAIR